MQQEMQQSNTGAQAYPMPSGINKIETTQVYDNPADDPDYEPKRQCFGSILALLAAIVASSRCAQNISDLVFKPSGKIEYALECISYGLFAYFYAISFYNPKYLGGNPPFLKLWPFALAFIISDINYFILKYCFTLEFDFGDLFAEVFIVGLINLIMYFIFIRNDASESFLLCLKPWVYKKKKIAYIVPEQVYGHGQGGPYQSGPYLTK